MRSLKLFLRIFIPLCAAVQGIPVLPQGLEARLAGLARQAGEVPPASHPPQTTPSSTAQALVLDPHARRPNFPSSNAPPAQFLPIRHPHAHGEGSSSSATHGPGNAIPVKGGSESEGLRDNERSEMDAGALGRKINLELEPYDNGKEIPKTKSREWNALLVETRGILSRRRANRKWRANGKQPPAQGADHRRDEEAPKPESSEGGEDLKERQRAMWRKATKKYRDKLNKSGTPNADHPRPEELPQPGSSQWDRFSLQDRRRREWRIATQRQHHTRIRPRAQNADQGESSTAPSHPSSHTGSGQGGSSMGPGSGPGVGHPVAPPSGLWPSHTQLGGFHQLVGPSHGGGGGPAASVLHPSAVIRPQARTGVPEHGFVITPHTTLGGASVSARIGGGSAFQPVPRVDRHELPSSSHGGGEGAAASVVYKPIATRADTPAGVPGHGSLIHLHPSHASTSVRIGEGSAFQPPKKKQRLLDLNRAPED